MKRRVVTNGIAQHALARIEAHLKYDLKLKLHSPRNFFATCASRLRFPLEERGKLGRRAKGSVMPDRYGRALCATELRLRGDVINRINRGWRPTGAFEVPPSQEKGPSDTSSCDSTSVTSTASSVLRKREAITDLYD